MPVPTDHEAATIRSLYAAMFAFRRVAALVMKKTGGDVEAFDAFYAPQLELT